MFETFRRKSSRTMLSQHGTETSHVIASPASSRNTQFTRPRKKQWLLLGLIFSSMIALLARRRRSLTRSGAAGTIAVGTTIFGMGGWSWGLSLIYFFVSSTLFSHYREREKARTAADKFSKGSERDIGQVAANGGLATLLALIYGLTNSLPFRKSLQAGFTGALATATADTWATELGVLSPHYPRLITTGKRVAPGTSGGITALGTVASALGAFSLGAVFWGLQGFSRAGASPLGVNLRAPTHPRAGASPAPTIHGTGGPIRGMEGDRAGASPAPTIHGTGGPIRGMVRTMLASVFVSLPFVALVSGLAGSFFDSLLGATVQAMYYCPACEKETERRIHSCGTRTTYLRGISWVDNDVVNFLATMFGGLVALSLALFSTKQ